MCLQKIVKVSIILFSLLITGCTIIPQRDFICTVDQIELVKESTAKCVAYYYPNWANDARILNNILEQHYILCNIKAVSDICDEAS